MKNESVVIDQNIVVTVIEIRGDKVRLGFELPKEIPIHRREVYEAIRGFQETPFEPVPASPPVKNSPDPEHL
jgi:carbon storage regulator